MMPMLDVGLKATRTRIGWPVAMPPSMPLARIPCAFSLPFIRAAFKPTPSILKAVDTIGRDGKPAMASTGGRHDPCVAIRGAPVVEAMVALVLADHKLLHRGQCG